MRQKATTPLFLNSRRNLSLAMALGYIISKCPRKIGEIQPLISGVEIDPIEENNFTGQRIHLSLDDCSLQILVSLSTLGLQQSLIVHSRQDYLEALAKKLYAFLSTEASLKKRGFVIVNLCRTLTDDQGAEDVTRARLATMSLRQGATHQKKIPNKSPKKQKGQAVVDDYATLPEALDEETQPLPKTAQLLNFESVANARYSGKFFERSFWPKELGKLYPLLLSLARDSDQIAPSFLVKNYAWQLNGLLVDKQIPDWWSLSMIRLIDLGIVEKIDKITIMVHRVKVTNKTPLTANQQKTTTPASMSLDKGDQVMGKPVPSTTPTDQKLIGQNYLAITWSASREHFKSQTAFECYQAILEIACQEGLVRPDLRSLEIVGLGNKLCNLATAQQKRRTSYNAGFKALIKDQIAEDLGYAGGHAHGKKFLVHRVDTMPEDGVQDPTPLITDIDCSATTSSITDLLGRLTGHSALLRQLGKVILSELDAQSITFERQADNSVAVHYRA